MKFKTQIDHCDDESKNMLIHHAIFFHRELFLWFISWLSARSTTLLMLSSVRTCTASLHG